MNIDKYINDLKEKYNYNNELCSFLKKVIPALITYYGTDKTDLILSAIEDTEIHIQEENEDMYEYLNNYFNVKNKWNIPVNGAAFLENEYVLTGNVISSKTLLYIKQVFYGEYIPFDYNNPICISNIVHELCHLVKSYGTIDYKDGMLKSNSGLINEYYKCNINNGLLVEYKNEFVGLEEAFNTVDEEEILKLMNIKCIKENEYVDMANMLKKLFVNSDIKESFNKSHFGSDEWRYSLNNDAIVLSKLFDDWLILIYTPMNIRIMDDEYNNKIISIKEKINNIILKYNKENTKS